MIAEAPADMLTAGSPPPAPAPHGPTAGASAHKEQKLHLPRGFPCVPAGKESSCNVGDLGLIPGLGRYPGEGKGYPLQYSGLENSMDCV